MFTNYANILEYPHHTNMNLKRTGLTTWNIIRLNQIKEKIKKTSGDFKMAELIEEYLHSSEIQRKITVATEPRSKTKPVSELINNMFYCGTTPPENPKQGDMYLDLASGHSVCHVYDGERFVVVGAAYSEGFASALPAGYPYERAYPDEMPIVTPDRITATQLQNFREEIEREYATNPPPMFITAADRLRPFEPGVMTEMELPVRQIRMGTPIVAEAIQELREVNRNLRSYNLDYAGELTFHNHDVTIERRAMDTNVRPNNVVQVRRNGEALPDGITRTANALPPDGARRNLSVSGTLNNVNINMDAWRSLFGGR